jgi:hypothetical protein
MIKLAPPNSKLGWLTWNRLLLGLLAIICIFATMAVYRWNQLPVAFVSAGEALDAIPEQERKQMGRHIENAVRIASQGFALDPASRKPVREAGPNSRIREVERGKPQTLRVYVNEANAWLRHRMPGWQKNQQWAIPDAIHDLRIAVVDQKLHLMLHYRSDELDQVFTFVGGIRINEQGQIVVERDRVMGGRQSLPWSVVRSALESASASDPTFVNTLLDTMEGKPVALDWKTTDKRPIVLVDFGVGDDYFEVIYMVPPAE